VPGEAIGRGADSHRKLPVPKSTLLEVTIVNNTASRLAACEEVQEVAKADAATIERRLIIDKLLAISADDGKFRESIIGTKVALVKCMET